MYHTAFLFTCRFTESFWQTREVGKRLDALDFNGALDLRGSSFAQVWPMVEASLKQYVTLSYACFLSVSFSGYLHTINFYMHRCICALSLTHVRALSLFLCLFLFHSSLCIEVELQLPVFVDAQDYEIYRRLRRIRKEEPAGVCKCVARVCVCVCVHPA